MKIIIISGFLGAGKTRFIQEMAKKTGRQFVVVENEFGEQGIDGALLARNSQAQTNPENAEMKVWELTEGCICCSLNVNFSHSVLTIANTLSPDYLLIEPSGVAYLSKILAQLNAITYEQISLNAPIMLIDAHNFEHSRANYPDYFRDQLNFAGTIVLSKSEQYSPQDFERVKTSLSLPPDIDFPLKHYSQWTKEEWLALLENQIQLEVPKSGRILRIFCKNQPLAKPSFESMSLTSHRLTNVDELNLALMLLLSPYFGAIERAKGYCQLGQHWVKFDLVGKEYAITGCEPMNDERIVVIGKNLERDRITRLFLN